MKKTKIMMLCGMAAVMASCGGGLSAGACIDVAENSVELKESPMLGELPSISERYILARTTAENTFHELYSDLVEKRDADGMDDMWERKEEVLKDIDEYYTDELNEQTKELKGKELPAKFNEDVFSSAKVSVEKIGIISGGTFKVYLDIELEPVSDIDRSQDAYIVYMLDKNGDKLKSTDFWDRDGVHAATFSLGSDGHPLIPVWEDNALLGYRAYSEGVGLYFDKNR